MDSTKSQKLSWADITEQEEQDDGIFRPNEQMLLEFKKLEVEILSFNSSS